MEIEISHGTDLSEGELALSVIDGLFRLSDEGRLFSQISDSRNTACLTGLTMEPLDESV